MVLFWSSVDFNHSVIGVLIILRGNCFVFVF